MERNANDAQGSAIGADATSGLEAQAEPKTTWSTFADFDSSAYLYADFTPDLTPELTPDFTIAEPSQVVAIQAPMEAHIEVPTEAPVEFAFALDVFVDDGGTVLAQPDLDVSAELFEDAQDAVQVEWALEPGHEIESSEEPEGNSDDAVVIEAAPLIEQIERIPDKMAFKIGEAADMIGVKQYVLRYWESEFDQLRPKKSKNNQRVYSRRDVETGLMIKKLLYVDRFSIEGARSALRQLKRDVREERDLRAVATAHDTAVKGLRALVGRIDKARERLSQRL